MKRSYKFLLRPTTRQVTALSGMLVDHCGLYNAALQERRDAYRHPSRIDIRHGEQSAQLGDIRTFDPERQGRWSVSSQQATLRRLNEAFAAFFRRGKAGEKPGYPRFKDVGHFDTVEFPKDGDGCRWNSTPNATQTRVRLQGAGNVKGHQHRAVRDRVKAVSVEREGRRWFVELSCDGVPAEPLPETGNQVGIDVRAVHFATTSDGEHVANPRHGQQAADEPAEAQRHLATLPKRRPANRTKKHRQEQQKRSRLHRKVARQRADYHHETVLELVRQHDVIAHEKVNIAGTTRAPEPKPDPDSPGQLLPNRTSAKAGSTKSILDAGRGQFLTILVGKVAARSEWTPATPRKRVRTVGTWTARTTSTGPPSPACSAEAPETRTWLVLWISHAEPGWPSAAPRRSRGKPAA